MPKRDIGENNQIQVDKSAERFSHLGSPSQESEDHPARRFGLRFTEVSSKKFQEFVKQDTRKLESLNEQTGKKNLYNAIITRLCPFEAKTAS